MKTITKSLEQRWLNLPTRWRIPLTLLCWLAGIGMVIGIPVLIQSLQTPGAALYVHNHTDRPIYSYWVNGNWGGNVSAYGGGKATCCWKIVGEQLEIDRKSTRLNSSHVKISYAVFCLKKKKKTE